MLDPCFGRGLSNFIMEFNLFPICGWTTRDGKPAVIGFAGKAHAGKDIAGKYLVD